MIVLISPAKTLDYNSTDISLYTQPEFQKETKELVGIMKKKSQKAIKDLMKVSDAIATLNEERYGQFEDEFNRENAKQALLAFKGDVYTKIDVEAFSKSEFDFAQKHLRILSGLYGLLKPLDLIQPYRLEMGIPLRNKKGKNLYEFWGSKISKAINEAAEGGPIINLASQEYFKSVKKKAIKSDITTPVFKEYKGRKYSVIGIFAKQARGLMTNFIIKNGIQDPEDLKNFQDSGYEYAENLSNKNEWVFIR
ncbi:MAG: peroxide stress protein YaaA [Cyclobacteriaceae bacterium]